MDSWSEILQLLHMLLFQCPLHAMSHHMQFHMKHVVFYMAPLDAINMIS